MTVMLRRNYHLLLPLEHSFRFDPELLISAYFLRNDSYVKNPFPYMNMDTGIRI
jgi:hypothetical protein